MGRLFWKFFFAIWGALLVTSVGVFLAVSHWHQRPGPPFAAAPGADRPPPLPPGMRLGSGDWPPPPGPGKPPPRPDPGGLPPPPILHILIGLLASLGFSAALAWYVAKPLRSLRWALGEFAAGRLETRVQPLMAGRRDEIADVGRDFDRMAQELQHLIAAQRRLLHDVSHELRSPLARLQVAIGLARQAPETLTASLDRIEREAQRLDHLVGELLTLARLEAGAGEGRLQRFDLIELLAEIAEDARFEARTQGRDLRFSGQGEFVMDASIELLHRAFENVLRNAVKYTAEGTAVEVGVARRCGDGELVVEVCDRGPGLPESELEAVFEPFHRCGNAGVDGFGLGLAIARRAIAAHGGAISARNREGGGLCVEIALPSVQKTMS